MELRNHTDSRVLDWRRCKSVVLDGDTLSWQLSESGAYDVLAAYGEKPHREFQEANNDHALRLFVRRWGPLRRLTSGADSMPWYRKRRDLVDRTMRLIAAVGSPDLRDALAALMLVSDESNDALNSFFRLNGTELGIESDENAGIANRAMEWLENAPLAKIEQVSYQFIRDLPITAMPSFAVQKQRGQPVVRASLFINNLHEALWWMVWEDIFRGDPIRFCQECGTLIPNNNKHFKKYCPGRCAKLVADRNYAARRRKREKRLKRGKL